VVARYKCVVSQPRICDRLGTPTLTSAGIYARDGSIRSADRRRSEASSVLAYCVAATASLSPVACTRLASTAAVDVIALYAPPTAIVVAWYDGPATAVET
jgi:hypothetical protein